MKYKINSYGMSDIGYIRTNNEDAWDMIAEKKFFIIADGMGGHQAGEIAASEAIKSITTSIRNAPPFLASKEICAYLLKSIEIANQKILQLSLENTAFRGMGTTLCCFIIHQDHLIYAHVGDSRLYRFRHTLQQLSQDHSLKNSLSQENIDPELLEQPGFKNVITRALGIQSYIMPDIGVINICVDDIYMLCSDGLTDLILDEQLSFIITSGTDLKNICQKLISTALKKGGHDNITVLLTHIIS